MIGARLVWMAIFLCLCLPGKGQPLAFRTLGVEQGMRTLTSWHCAFDGFGYLWVSTSDGLVRYNGKEVSYYYTQTHPELPSDPTGYLFCDHLNNLWICTPKGLTKANRDRILKRQVIWPDDLDRQVNFCVEDSEGAMIIFSHSQCFRQQVPDGPWTSQPWLDSIVDGARIRDIRRYDDDAYLVIMPSRGVALVNLKTKKEVAFFPFSGVSHAAGLDDNRIILSAGGPFAIYLALIDKPEDIIPLASPPFLTKGDLKTEIEHLVKAKDGKFYIATDGSGLIVYDHAAGRYRQYLHDPANPLSIAENSLRYIIQDTLGNIAFTSLSGANFTNVRPQEIAYYNSFKTITGEVFDDRVISIAEDTLHQLWIVMENGVVVMGKDRAENKLLKLPPNADTGNVSITYAYATADHHGRIWVAMKHRGIGLFRPDGSMETFISPTSFKAGGNTIGRIRIMKPSDDGWMYIGTENGLFRIHQQRLSLDTFPDEPAIHPLRSARIVDIMPEEHDIWVSTSPGGAAWHYQFDTKQLKKYTKADGLLSERVYGMAKDEAGSIYIGSYSGLTIIHRDGRIDGLSKGNGLPSTRIDAVVRAPDGMIWLTNTYNLLRYDPLHLKVSSVIGNSGFSRVNYQIMSSAVLSSGELVFGAHKGMVIVDASQPFRSSDSLKIFIFYKNASGHEYLCTPEEAVHVNAHEQFIRFTFGISDLLHADKMMYRYRVMKKGFGPWSAPSHLAGAEFNLGPGTYQLEVEAYDGHQWMRGPGPIRISIEFPWWRKWWVLTLAALGLCAGVWIYFKERIRKYRTELMIERQISELESKALRAQMNPHFVFNSLNAIQECIMTGKVDEAYTYLSRFSRLLRLVLEHSDVADISLHEELEVLSLFVSLEQLRFRNDIQFVLELDSKLDQEEIRIPPMLIQPHLENAIWHGLRNKEGEKILKLTMEERIPGYLEVTVTDNGVGRVKAEAIRKHSLRKNHHTPKGKQISANRLQVLKRQYPLVEVTVTDLYTTVGLPAGTGVKLIIPILEHSVKTQR